MWAVQNKFGQYNNVYSCFLHVWLIEIFHMPDKSKFSKNYNNKKCIKANSRSVQFQGAADVLAITIWASPLAGLRGLRGISLSFCDQRHWLSWPGLPGACDWKRPNSVSKKAKFWILLNKLLGKKGQTLNKCRLEKKANYLTNSQKFRGQTFKKRPNLPYLANLATLLLAISHKDCPPTSAAQLMFPQARLLTFWHTRTRSHTHTHTSPNTHMNIDTQTYT